MPSITSQRNLRLDIKQKRPEQRKALFIEIIDMKLVYNIGWALTLMLLNFTLFLHEAASLIRALATNLDVHQSVAFHSIVEYVLWYMVAGAGEVFLSCDGWPDDALILSCCLLQYQITMEKKQLLFNIFWTCWRGIFCSLLTSVTVKKLYFVRWWKQYWWRLLFANFSWDSPTTNACTNF